MHSVHAKIFGGDCLEVIPTLERVHLIVADPPYAFDKMGSSWRGSSAVRRTKGQTVSNLTSGMAFKPDQASLAVDYFVPFAAAFYEVLVEGGFALVFAAPRLAHGFALALERGGFAIRDQLIWQHNSGQFKAASLERFGVAKDHRVPQPCPQFESIIMAQKLPAGTLSDCWRRNQTGLMRERDIHGEVPSNILAYQKPGAAERIAGGKHPTQKPVALIEDLIHRFSLPYQTVLDPFVGSGTSVVAALNTGRNGIGIEADERFAEQSRLRLQGDSTK